MRRFRRPSDAKACIVGALDLLAFALAAAGGGAASIDAEAAAAVDGRALTSAVLQLLEQLVDVSVDVGSGRRLGGRGGAGVGVEDAQRVLLALVAQGEQKRFLDVHELVDVVELLRAGERPLCAV